MSIASYLRSYRAHVESLWFSGRASERRILRSEVRFQKGTQNFFFVPRSRQDEKHLSQNLLSLLIIIMIIIIIIIIMTLLDNTITGRTSSSHCGPLKLQIQIAKIRSKNTVKN